MRAIWTRDEVILGLDVLFSNTPAALTIESKTIVNLSETLNRLPIIPLDQREDYFRNPAGVRRQLLTFHWSQQKEIKASHVGAIFYEVFSEFKDNLEELHRIAQAIRRCVDSHNFEQYGDSVESEGFLEGAILSHLHRNIEERYTDKCEDTLLECEACRMHPKGIYAQMSGNSILSKHLLIAPADFDPIAKLTPSDFITVCPNCHRALHIIRPWRGRKESENIFIV
jgi:5-methylcytosine-specific restriction protein A